MSDVISVRCANCGEAIGHLYNKYRELASELVGDKDKLDYNHTVSLNPVFEQLELRDCCKQKFITFLPAYSIPFIYS